MAPRTITEAIADALEDLPGSELEKFCHRLLDRRAEPRVKCQRVEGKSRLQLTDVLVQTFTEATAGSVTVELLRQINCNTAAERLENEIARLSPKPEPGSKSSVATPSFGQERTDVHFVDKHRNDLIQRVSHVDLILDELLGKKAIQQEMYDHIRAISTSQNKMREIYSTCLKASKVCDIFYTSLRKNEPFLIEELESNKNM